MRGKTAKAARKGARIIAAAQNGGQPAPWAAYQHHKRAEGAFWVLVPEPATLPMITTTLAPTCGRAIYQRIKANYARVKRRAVRGGARVAP